MIGLAVRPCVNAQAQRRQETRTERFLQACRETVPRERSSVVAKLAMFGISIEAALSRSFAIFSLALALPGLSLGCSSSDDPSPPAPGGTGGGPTIHPNAQPCNISTGY